MKAKFLIFSVSLVFMFAVTGCQQDNSPVAPKALTPQKASVNKASTATSTAGADSVKPGDTSPDRDLDPEDRTDPRQKNSHGISGPDTEDREVPTADEDLNMLLAGDGGGRDISTFDGGVDLPQEFRVRVDPEKWNKSWTNSDGLVTVRIVGMDFESIDPGTIQMECDSCPEPADPPAIFPVRWRFGPYSLTAKFKKGDAIGLITDPQRGEVYQLSISFSMQAAPSGTVQIEDPGDGGDYTLPFMITILGKKPSPSELYLVIRPKKWNKSWANPDNGDNGDDDLVTARIMGEGFEDVVPGSLSMAYGECGDPDSPEISPTVEELGGVAYIAKFEKSDAIGLIEDPKRGERHPIRVMGQLEGGEPFCLSSMVLINGKKSGEGPLTLVIRPKSWNMAWLESDEDGDVTARIKGEDFEKIDPATIRLSVNGDSIAPYSYEFAGFAFMAKFRQSEAIALIPDPPAANSYEVRITGALTDATPLPATLVVSVKIKTKKN